MRIAFVVDPLRSLKAYKDTSIALMRAAQAAGHAVWAVRQEAIHWSAQHGVRWLCFSTTALPASAAAANGLIAMRWG